MSGFYDYFLKLLKTIFLLKGGIIVGKLDLQKSFYFCKELGMRVPFKFRWGKLGPYSYELSNVMNRVSAQGFAPYTGDYEYDESRFRNIQELDVPANVFGFFDDIDDTLEKSGFKRVPFVEAAASLHFLRKYSGMTDKRSTFAQLYELKESRMSFLIPLLESAWGVLHRHDLVDDTTPNGA